MIFKTNPKREEEFCDKIKMGKIKPIRELWWDIDEGDLVRIFLETKNQKVKLNIQVK